MAKVLIVDQELSYCRSIAQQLMDEGHTIEFATTAPKAIELASEFLPDVLVADWIVHGEIGILNLSTEIRKINPNLRTVLMTGFPEGTIKLALDEAHVDQLLTKPFTLEELSQAVSFAIENAGQEGTE